MPEYEHIHQLKTQDRYGFLLILIVETQFFSPFLCFKLRIVDKPQKVADGHSVNAECLTRTPKWAYHFSSRQR